jgi:hypothetical protein
MEQPKPLTFELC